MCSGAYANRGRSTGRRARTTGGQRDQWQRHTGVGVASYVVEAADRPEIGRLHKCVHSTHGRQGTGRRGSNEATERRPHTTATATSTVTTTANCRPRDGCALRHGRVMRCVTRAGTTGRWGSDDRREGDKAAAANHGYCLFRCNKACRLSPFERPRIHASGERARALSLCRALSVSRRQSDSCMPG